MGHVPWHPEEATKEIQKGDSVHEMHGIESIELISVGIDIGTTTSHLMFSRLIARRKGEQDTSSFQIDDRDPIYQSPISLTPYENSTSIDTEKLNEFIEQSFAEAGYTKEEVDTGAVIITGEASRKENAEEIVELFAEQAGQFVCATAGASLETLMSAHGSGAVDYSVDKKKDVIHIDIGGGTTKIAAISEGFVKETASINVGARLIAVDDTDRITRLEDSAVRVAEDLGITLSKGEKLEQEHRRLLGERFSELIFELITGQLSPLARELMVTEEPTFEDFDCDVLTFAGGGSEYVYERDAGYYNDLGPELGSGVREEIARSGIDVFELETGIRATAIGSTQHSVQVSGNTITVTNTDYLPIQNVPMVPFVANHHEAVASLVQTVHKKLALYNISDVNGPFAFGFHTHGKPTADFIEMIGDAVIEGREEVHTSDDEPLILMFESDMAMNTGKHVASRIEQPVIAVDGVELDQFGYVDIGEQLDDTNAVPLTIKSLIFEG